MLSATDPPSTFAHCPQKRLSGGLGVPHFGQTAASGVAHSPQKREPAGLSWWHREHFIEPGLNPESLVGPRGAGQEPGTPPPAPWFTNRAAAGSRYRASRDGATITGLDHLHRWRYGSHALPTSARRNRHHRDRTGAPRRDGSGRGVSALRGQHLRHLVHLLRERQRAHLRRERARAPALG